MASNEDKRTSTTEHETPKVTTRIENPFIAFRRFADETIGSALQRIVGLPSAVHKQLEGALPGLEKIRTENARRFEEARAEGLILQEKLEKEHQQEKLPNQDSEAPHELIEELRRHRKQNRKRWEHIREAIHQGPDAAYTARGMTRDNDAAERTAFRSLRNDSGRERDFNRLVGPTGPADEFVDYLFKHVGMLAPNSTFGPLGAVIFSRLSSIMSSDGFGPYVIFSPYSPLFLSNRTYSTADKHAQDSFPYCDAFEDLLLASRGMDMVPLEERRRRQSALRQCPGRPQDLGLAASWLSRLQRQGLLEGRTDERLEEDDGSELAMYSRFLNSAFPKEAGQIPVSVRQLYEAPKEASNSTNTKIVEPEKQQAPSNDGILSTLTRTESTRYPDGRVETKVVLIKRFADGVETRTETVHTDHEGAGPDQGRVDDSKQTAKDEKKGWFWN